MIYSKFSRRYRLQLHDRPDYKELIKKYPNVTDDEALSMLHCISYWDYKKIARDYKEQGKQLKDALFDGVGCLNPKKLVEAWNE